MKGFWLLMLPIGFIVHSNINTEFCYAASISYNIKEHRMFAFVHCLDSRILRNFLSLIDSATHEILTTFWMIPSILVELGLEWIQRTQDAYHDDIYQLETATGVRRDSSTTEDLENTDLRKLTRDVNFTITNLDFHSYSLDTLRPILHAVDDAVRLYRKKVLAINTSNTWASQVERAVLEKNAYLCAWSDGMGKRGKYLQERGQAQVQTVSSQCGDRPAVTLTHARYIA